MSGGPVAGDPLTAWAASGAMALTGRSGGPPLGPPAGLVERLVPLGDRLGIDPLALLGERAAIAGLTRNGAVSCGGATRLLRTADGWVALALARPEDIELVPALLAGQPVGDDPWAAVVPAARSLAAEVFVDRARELGLPAARLPADAVPGDEGLVDEWPVRISRIDGAANPRPPGDARVADLGALWAGPLCGSLLADAGAEVIKVESSRRPDGARAGPPEFFALVNAGKLGVSLDLQTTAGRAALTELLAGVDVVIEASRPRALEQLGIDRAALVAGAGPQVWLSITGHGRPQPQGGWVAFGDDAAVAGGLVAWDDEGPCFSADAVADPLTGMVATVAVIDALQRGGRWLIDVAMADVAAWCSGPTLAVPVGLVAVPPRARRPTAPAPGLGEHNGLVLAAVRR